MLWASPCSAIGALFGGLMLLGGGSLRRLEGTLEFALSPRLAASAFGRWLPFAAITFGQVILGVSHDELARVRAHERVHVQQYERLGVLFLIAYPLASVLAWRRGLCPYRGNCFEVEAYAVDDGGDEEGSSDRDEVVDDADRW
ncbi:MAG: hypothetical protein JNL84_11320 [Candidatus Accumulibacter sp.]|nr:hypothetical protein [Accumulibacter sp.]